MGKGQRLRRWELALALSVCLTVGQGAVLNGCAWWGVIFPGLTAQEVIAETAAETPRQVQLRLRLWDWLTAQAELLFPGEPAPTAAP